MMPAINVNVNTQSIPVVIATQNIGITLTAQSIPVTISALTTIPVIVGVQGPQGVQGVAVVVNSTDKIAGMTMGGNKAVMVDIDGLAYYADRSIISHVNKVLGITKTSVISGSLVSIQTYGVMTEPSWSWDMSLPIFLSTSGLLTQTAPTAGFLLMLGFPLSPSSMLIDIDKPVIKV